MPVIPMFPLGSVLFPHMPLGLRVFEPRYLELVRDVLGTDDPTFGVVLIERGWEVGGGDGRFQHGTLATITELTELEAPEGAGTMIGVGAQGGSRIVVHRWLPDEPYPRAEVDLIDPLPWRDELQGAYDRCEASVRRCLAIASEFSEATWPADIELSDDPAARCWQLASIAPLGQLDRIRLLRSDSLDSLITDLTALSDDAIELIRLQVQYGTDDD